MIMISNSTDRFNRFIYSLVFASIAYNSITIEWVSYELGDIIKYTPKHVKFPFKNFIEDVLLLAFEIKKINDDIFSYIIQISSYAINILILHCLLSICLADRFILNKIHSNIFVATIGLFMKWFFQLSVFSLSTIFLFFKNKENYFQVCLDLFIISIVSGIIVWLMSSKMNIKMSTSFNENSEKIN